MRRNGPKILTGLPAAAVLFCLAMLLVVGPGAGARANEVPAGTAAETVTIIRDKWGVPHIFAESDKGAMFGLGYACAEDRLFQMEYSRRLVQGRLAEMLGNIGSRGDTTLDSDIRNRHCRYYAIMEEVAGNLDKKTRKLLKAYCDGVNRYVADHAGGLHYLFDAYGITPEPWTPADCLAVWLRISNFFSPSWTGEGELLHEFEALVASGKTEEEAAAELIGGRVIDEDAAVVLESDFDPQLRAELDAYAAAHGYSSEPGAAIVCYASDSPPAPKFSHAWVIGASRSKSGAAVLNSDPQTTVRNPSIWHEFHVRGETFNARGIGVAGCPGFLIGWNENVAWGATALGADVADVFRLDTDPREPGVYTYNGKKRTLKSRSEMIYVRGGAPLRITVRWSLLGPVVSELLSDRRRDEEYALRTLPSYDPGRHTVQALIAMMRADDVYELAEALEGWRVPTVNLVFGDSQGNIGYWAQAAIPLRSPLAPLGGRAAQYGKGGKYDWVEIIPHRFLPHVINPASGALFSGNHLPVGSWYPLSLLIGTGGSGDTQRSWRLRELLAGGGKFKPTAMQHAHFDDVSPAMRNILRAGYHARATGSALCRGARDLLDTLQQWYADGCHCDTSEPYLAGAYHIGINFRANSAGALHDIYGGGESGLCYFLKTLNAKLDADPNYQLDPDELAYIDASLQTGWDVAVANYGSDPEDWQAAFNATTARLQVPYFKTLEGFPSLDPSMDFTSETLHDPVGYTIWAQRGNSYSQWVNLANVDGSRAMLPIGASENPESPYYRDQQHRWERGALRPAPLSRKRVRKYAVSTTELTY